MNPTRGLTFSAMGTTRNSNSVRIEGAIANSPWLPHVMLFIPHGQATAWGAGLEGSPILGTENTPIEPTVLLIPVRRWSDGSPVPIPSEHHH